MTDIAYETHRLDWRGLEIEVRYCPDWMLGRAHIEVEFLCRSPLPITETGYRSHFTTAETVAELGGPVQLVETWLDETASGAGWKDAEAKRRQLSLF